MMFPIRQKSSGTFPTMFPIAFPIRVRDSLGVPAYVRIESRAPRESRFTTRIESGAPLPAEVCPVHQRWA